MFALITASVRTRGGDVGAGLRDAMNLAWKIAGVCRGDLAAAVLDSYEAERRPHARHMIGLALNVGRAMTAGGRVDYLICDEAQFYTPEQVDQLARIVDELDIEVYAFGITSDFRTQLFPGSQRLIELADRIQVLQVSALCWCGCRATHNARVVDGVMVVEGEQVVVGDTANPQHEAEVEYEVLCRRHHMRRMSSRAARAVAQSADVLPFDLDACPVPPPT